MSTPTGRERLVDAEQRLTASEAGNAKLRAEIEALRTQIWNRRSQIHGGKLTETMIDKAIKQARKDGKRHSMSDGLGLTLQIFPQVNRGLVVSWLFRWTVTISKGNYDPRCVGLGSLNETPLAKARELTVQCRLWLREGKDPEVEVKRMRHPQPETFRTVAQVVEEYLELKIKPKSKAYYDQTKQRLRDYVLKHIGKLPIQSVTMHLIKETLLKDDFWSEKTQTAKETQLYLQRIFEWAIHKKYFVGENPARWRGGLEHELPRPSDLITVKHRQSLNFRKLPEFIEQLHAARDRALANHDPIVKYVAVEFLVKTGARVNELLQAQWHEFDREEATWNVPGAHTKSGNPRAVPLPRTLHTELEALHRLSPNHTPKDLVFPGVFPDIPGKDKLGKQTLLRVLRNELKITNVDNHGWRSTLKDWCTARAAQHCPGYVLEWYRMQCDHWEGVPKTEMAYGPDRLLEERRGMMQAYDDFATPPPTESKSDKVVAIPKRRSA
jgi:integrase